MEQQICYRCMKQRKNRTVCRYCKDDSRIPNEPHQLAAGTVLKERYFIGRALGQGGFGITYIGMDLKENRYIAVKEYFPSGMAVRDVSLSSEVRSLGADDSGWLEKHKKRFLREYRTLSELSEIPQIVKVSDFFFENNTAYIVMEYIKGKTLKQYVSDHDGRLSQEETFRILKPVMRSLAKIHKAGLIHRDVSPDNLIILPDGSAKLLDFGAARDIGADADAGMPVSKSVTAVFKNGYAPLEQYQSRGSLGPWTDVYALCATACYCLTGEAPPEALERLLQDTPVRISEKGADISPLREKVLKKGLALRASERIADMEQLFEMLFEQPEETEEMHGDRTDSAGKWNGKRTPYRKRRWMILAAGTAFFCMAGIFFFRSFESSSNKVIAAPVYFRDVSVESSDWINTGTRILLGCGDVDAFSESYTLSCSLYIPKAACRKDGSKVNLIWWLDMDNTDTDVHIGTADSICCWNLINSQNEIFPVIEDRAGNVQRNSEYESIFQIEEKGDFYMLKVRDLPFEGRLHSEDGSDRNIAIDPSQSGRIGIGMHVTGLNQSLSSVVYLDDIVIKDHGTVIRSIDCSAKSLYDYWYMYEYDGEDGQMVSVERPELSVIRLNGWNWMWWR